MLLNKTPLARNALKAGTDAGLSLLERRILILADGKRSLDTLAGLLGPEILPMIDRLLRDGYLQRDEESSRAPMRPGAGVAGALTGLLRATTDALQARSEQIRAETAKPAPTVAVPADLHVQPLEPSASAAATPAPASTRQRRSLVGAKMYLIDMLQLQRHPDAVEHKARIQLASGDDALLAALLDGLRALQQLTPPSYAERIAIRLGEVLPEQWLPALAQVVATSPTPPSDGAGAPPALRLVSG
ncbi:MAG: hypothetical protein J0I72_02650 [Stenotrophomonas sp.]|nr:hypothetical protein [Xanthomonadales bacterium]MBN8768234.1 hypothetical protein [Stenotrophomonas sp.]